nr:hypothetical protein Itr_chr11CG05100 [Ipomoea trifida]
MFTCWDKDYISITASLVTSSCLPQSSSSTTFGSSGIRASMSSLKTLGLLAHPPISLHDKMNEVLARERRIKDLFFSLSLSQLEEDDERDEGSEI